MNSRPYSWKVLALGGAILVGLGLYFVFLRPPVLPEDPSYMGTSLSEIQSAVPGLGIWLKQVFRVMGGYMFSTGLMTLYMAITSFRARVRGVAVVAALAGLTSIGWMSAVNFIINSDFKWLIFAFTLPWGFALALFWIEGRTGERS